MTDQTTPSRKLQGTEKLAVELGPVIAFMVVYFMPDRFGPMLDGLIGGSFFSTEGNALFLALAVFMPLFAVAFAWSVWKERRIAPMLLVTAVILLIFGSMTFIFQDKTFFYVKLTILYGLFAAVLGGGLMLGQNYLKIVFDGALDLPDDVWRTLTWRFVAFFAIVAIANEIIWRALIAMDRESIYITLKMIGVPIVYLLFMVLQAPLLAKYLEEDKDTPDETQEEKTASSASAAMTEKDAGTSSGKTPEAGDQV